MNPIIYKRLHDRRTIVLIPCIAAYIERRRHDSDWLQRGFMGDRRNGKDRRLDNHILKGD